MTLQNFLNRLAENPDTVEFEESMAIIDENYDFTPTAFQNGKVLNAANQNNGSCKILAFGQLNDLTVKQTLACFGRFYRDDVLGNAEGEDHQNIRHFILTGWEGIKFDATPLTPKTTAS